MSGYILEVENITKEFPGVKALDNVSFRVKKGSVHALIGENGAGKSTLMKIIAGHYSPDSGTLKFDDQTVEIKSPQKALDLGISMIFQELLPVYDMTVGDNIFLGRYPKSAGVFVRRRHVNRKTQEIFDSMNVDNIAPNSLMKDLSAAKLQMVEIAKAVSRNAKLIIMDEPTSSLSEAEVEKLFKVIKQLKSQGVGIVYISHKLDELFKISDEITVFRDGQFIGTGACSDFDEDKLVKMMVGRDLKGYYNKEVSDEKFSNAILDVRDLSSGSAFQNVSFSLHRGEILGIAGLVGAGRTELVETIFGLRKATGGEIYKDGKKLRIRNPKDAIRNKIVLATEDRKRLGLFLDFPITYNLSISRLSELNRVGFVQKKKVLDKTKWGISALNIKANKPSVLVGNLSGGNQQKVVLAKWLITEPEILILDEPTRGIDVGAKSEIYKIMESLAAEGKAIIMISSEMPEILGVSDRIMVLSEGKLQVVLDRKDATQEKIGQYI